MTESRFERLLVILVAGGIAVALNGVIRATDNLDLPIDALPDNVERRLRVLRGVGEGHASELSVADFADEKGAVRIIADFPIDVFTHT